jgi:hypothetical protein
MADNGMHLNLVLGQAAVSLHIQEAKQSSSKEACSMMGVCYTICASSSSSEQF